MVSNIITVIFMRICYPLISLSMRVNVATYLSLSATLLLLSMNTTLVMMSVDMGKEDR